MLTVIERQCADGTWNYGTLVDLRRMAGHPTIGDLRGLLSQTSAHPTAARQPRPVALLATEAVLYNQLCAFAALARGRLTIETIE
jgi:hypothetical protein